MATKMNQEQYAEAVHARNALPAMRHMYESEIERVVQELIYGYRDGKATFEFMIGRVAAIAHLQFMWDDLNTKANRVKEIEEQSNG